MTEHSNLQAQQQYKNFVVHCKRQPYDVYIGRKSRGAPPGDLCEWGNPFNMKNQSQAERDRVVHEYRCWLVSQPDLVARAQKELRGKVLACWCSPKLCHGHILAEIANSPQYGADGESEEKVENTVQKMNIQSEKTIFENEDFPALGAPRIKTVTIAKCSKAVPAKAKRRKRANIATHVAKVVQST